MQPTAGLCFETSTLLVSIVGGLKLPLGPSQSGSGLLVGILAQHV